MENKITEKSHIVCKKFTLVVDTILVSDLQMLYIINMRILVYTIAGALIGVFFVVFFAYLQFWGIISYRGPELEMYLLFGLPLFFGVAGAWLGNMLNKRTHE